MLTDRQRDALEASRKALLEQYTRNLAVIEVGQHAARHGTAAGPPLVLEAGGCGPAIFAWHPSGSLFFTRTTKGYVIVDLKRGTETVLPVTSVQSGYFVEAHLVLSSLSLIFVFSPDGSLEHTIAIRSALLVSVSVGEAGLAISYRDADGGLNLLVVGPQGHSTRRLPGTAAIAGNLTVRHTAEDVEIFAQEGQLLRRVPSIPGELVMVRMPSEAETFALSIEGAFLALHYSDGRAPMRPVARCRLDGKILDYRVVGSLCFVLLDERVSAVNLATLQTIVSHPHNLQFTEVPSLHVSPARPDILAVLNGTSKHFYVIKQQQQP